MRQLGMELGRVVLVALVSSSAWAGQVLRAETSPAQDSDVRMSFFVTSVGTGRGGDLGGLAGADAHCQALAAAVGAGDRTWRAYLSTGVAGAPGVNARDRIGDGPWMNARGALVASSVEDLHEANRLSKAVALSESGAIVPGRTDEPNLHDILTGSLEDGTPAVGMTCDNWTSDDAGQAMVGHHDREGAEGALRSWNSTHASRGCSMEDLSSTGGAGLFYCFAID